MGNKKIVQCPFYISKQKGGIITCENLEDNLGFSVNTNFKFESLKEREDYFDIFCTDLYMNCPYFKALEKIKYKVK